MSQARLLRVVALAALALAVVACGSKAKKAEKPAELTAFQSTARIERVWRAAAGSSAPKLRLGLSLAVDGDALFVANHIGEVTAYNKASGKRLWRTATKVKLTGGPGAGEGLVVAGASHGAIVALDAATGAVKWKTVINSEILAAPVVAKQVVLVRVVDGRVIAFAAADGRQLWAAEQQVPRLSLRGTAKPTTTGGMLLTGFDNGRVMALQVENGNTIWDTTVAPPAGRTELDRVNDVDTAVLVQGNDVYAVNFHGKAVRIDLETGQVVWNRDVSSYSGLALDAEGLYVTAADGALLKLNARTGVEVWRQPLLANRRLSAPAVLGDLVAVGDLDGYVHFFDAGTGAPAARLRPLSERVSADPLVSGDMLYMLDAGGGLVAMRATRVAAGTGTNTSAVTGSDGSAAPPLRPR